MTRVPRHLLFGQLVFIFSWFSCSSFSWLGPPRLRQPLTSFPWPPLHNALWCPVGAASVGTAKGSTLYTQSQILLFGWGGWKEFFFGGCGPMAETFSPSLLFLANKADISGPVWGKGRFSCCWWCFSLFWLLPTKRHGVPPCSVMMRGGCSLVCCWVEVMCEGWHALVASFTCLY